LIVKDLLSIPICSVVTPGWEHFGSRRCLNNA
jgi:hypothetical protein